jgi:hypothetical protein
MDPNSDARPDESPDIQTLTPRTASPFPLFGSDDDDPAPEDPSQRRIGGWRGPVTLR